MRHFQPCTIPHHQQLRGPNDKNIHNYNGRQKGCPLGRILFRGQLFLAPIVIMNIFIVRSTELLMMLGIVHGGKCLMLCEDYQRHNEKRSLYSLNTYLPRSKYLWMIFHFFSPWWNIIVINSSTHYLFYIICIWDWKINFKGNESFYHVSCAYGYEYQIYSLWSSITFYLAKIIQFISKLCWLTRLTR